MNLNNSNTLWWYLSTQNNPWHGRQVPNNVLLSGQVKSLIDIRVLACISFYLGPWYLHPGAKPSIYGWIGGWMDGFKDEWMDIIWFKVMPYKVQKTSVAIADLFVRKVQLFFYVFQSVNLKSLFVNFCFSKICNTLVLTRQIKIR